MYGLAGELIIESCLPDTTDSDKYDGYHCTIRTTVDFCAAQNVRVVSYAQDDIFVKLTCVQTDYLPKCGESMIECAAGLENLLERAGVKTHKLIA